MFEWAMRTWYVNDLTSTSLSNLRTSTWNDDVSEILEFLWTSSEQ